MDLLAHTINESCEISRVGRNTIYLAIGSGALRARKLGNRTVILDEDLRAWLQNLPLMVPTTNVVTKDASPPAETSAAPSPKRRMNAA
jgi:Helix-turn-helix domain